MDLPAPAGIAISAITLAATGLVAYYFGRCLFANQTGTQWANAGIALFRATGILLGLMLSMNFAATRSEYVKIQNSVELGAKEITELSEDLKRYASPEADVLLKKMVAYVKVVVQEEWPILAAGETHQNAWALFYDLEDGILKLEPQSDRQAEMKQRMLKDIDELSDHRHTRLYAGNVTMTWFLSVVLIVFLVSAFFFSTHPVRKPTLTFFAAYASVIAVVIYSIVALNRPYQGLTRVSVKPLQTIYQQMIGSPYIDALLKTTGETTNN